MTTNVLLKYYWQTQGSLLIICNGEAVLTKSMKPWVSNPLDKQFDIIHAIRANIQQTKIKWSSKHVQGHQNQVALDTNDKVRWNDAIDQAAKNHWMKIQTQLDPMMHSLLGEPWELWLENEKISTAVKQWLIKHTCRQAVRAYWSNKTQFRGMDIKSIDWSMIQIIVTNMTIKQQWWTTKFTTGFCTTGQMMQRWGQQESAACPWCNHGVENTVHILQCPNPTAWEISARNTKELWAILKDLETEPDTIEDLSAGFHMWSLDQPPPPMLTNVGQLHSFILWDSFSHRFVAISWQNQQQQYYDNHQLQQSSMKWATEVLKWILKHAWQQWDHQNDELHWQQPNRVKDLEVNANIWEQYNIGTNKMPNASKVLFQETVNQTLSLLHNDKWQWLASVKAARDWHRRARARSTMTQWTLLQNWLQPQQLAAQWLPPDPDPMGNTNQLRN